MAAVSTRPPRKPPRVVPDCVAFLSSAGNSNPGRFDPSDRTT